MRITVDQDICIGAGQCVMTAPKVFDQREEDGVVVLLTDAPPAESRQAAQNAAAMCPAGAIAVSQG